MSLDKKTVLIEIAKISGEAEAGRKLAISWQETGDDKKALQAAMQALAEVKKHINELLDIA